MTSEILSMKTIINKLDFLKETVIVRQNTRKKKLLLFVKKLLDDLPDPCNAKQHYESFLRKKNRKIVKQSEIITYQPKTFKNPNIVDIKSVITEHPKTADKLSKIIRKGEKVDSNSSLYSGMKKIILITCFNQSILQSQKTQENL